MAAHIEWGHTDNARLHVLEPRQALEDLAPTDGRINGNAVLVIDCGNGDGARVTSVRSAHYSCVHSAKRH